MLQFFNLFNILIILIVTIALVLFFILSFYPNHHNNLNRAIKLKDALINDSKLIYKEFLRNKFFSLSMLAYFL